jgi:hypothetical protein
MNSFWSGFEKRSAARSEMAGAILTAPFMLPGTVVGLAAGPYKDEQLAKVNKRGLSNFIPGVGAYRHTRRLQTVGLPNEDR